VERDPDSVLLLQPLAMLESRAGNFEQALALIGRAGRMDGSDFLVSSVLGDVYYRMGDAQRLREVSQDSIDRIGLQNGFMAQYLIQALVMSGENELARQYLDTAMALRDEGQPYSATTIGLGLAALGETSDAARWLVQAERERDFWLRWHLRSALEDFPGLATEPAIESLTKRMGLDDSSIQQRKEQGR
jgi:tetratricopeptide (TPR) repeat protein